VAKVGGVMNFKQAIMSTEPQKLADAFEISKSTVLRWMSGLSEPHPVIQQRIILWATMEDKHDRGN
jgi:hypothetical protein